MKEFLEKLNIIIESDPFSLEERKKKFFAILIKSLKDKNILSGGELEKIAKLGIL